MTEEQAREVVERLVGRAATARLARLAAMVDRENERQNLISRSTVNRIWCRHILDSIQLVPLAGDQPGLWIDIGTGGGFPGLAVSLAIDAPVMLVEPRKQRAQFLMSAIDHLDVRNATVAATRIERIPDRASVVSARAVAPIPQLIGAAIRCSDVNTRWLLPRGGTWRTDVDDAKLHWQGTFHVEQSLSSPDAGIVIATGVRPR